MPTHPISGHRLPFRYLLVPVLAAALVLESAAPAAAFGGQFDNSFSGDGKLGLNLSSGEDYLWDVAIDPVAPRIVGVGATPSGWVIVGLRANGTLDSGFGVGSTGYTLTDFGSDDDYATAVAVQPDGKYVVVGRAMGASGKFGIARYDEYGYLDPTFSQNGVTTTDFGSGDDFAQDVAIQPNGKIVVAGRSGGTDSRFAVARYNANGGLDTTFSSDGKATANLTTGEDNGIAVELQADGKIVVAGYASGYGGRIGLARFNANGSLDSSFSGDGQLTKNFTSAIDVAWGLAIQPADGKIVLGGRAGGDNAKMVALRYNTDGTADTAFSGDGWMTVDITSFVDYASSVALQPDGSIVLGGSANFEFYALVRLTAAGSLDPTFGDGGTRIANITAGFDVLTGIALQADGSIVGVGESSGKGGQISAARFLGS